MLEGDGVVTQHSAVRWRLPGSSWRSRVGWGLFAWALSVVCVALPVWAVTAGNLNEVAGWANILALPVTAPGLVLVLADPCPGAHPCRDSGCWAAAMDGTSVGPDGGATRTG